MTTAQALYGGGVLLAGLLAIFLGGPLTLWVFRHVEQRARREKPGPTGQGAPEQGAPGQGAPGQGASGQGAPGQGAPGQRPPRQGVLGLTAAAVVLRGGSVIGQLERTAVYVGIVVGWPEAIAGVIALKGLGRFAELRGDTDGAAERFMIGSFTSLLWAALLGGLGRACVTGFAAA
jgi:hypothetical protein